ncbi:2727_t:CDS:1 [Ambispora leptoticha]|uniref:2727_t:CDS:1 n=1 Tax=Ambispora leptoticha TaxID=144679 RepID=A0A9N8VVQ0_9GLOM|nr:2727_t:CDS:1 [Ambispora leptoticha]
MSEEEIQALAELLHSFVIRSQPCENFINELCEIYLKKGEDLKAIENSYFILKRFIREKLDNGVVEIPENLTITRNQITFVKVVSIIWKKLSFKQKSVYGKIRKNIEIKVKENYPNWKPNQYRIKATLKTKQGRGICVS